METIPNSSESVKNILESSVFLENVSSLLTNVSHPKNFLPIKTYIRIVNILNVEKKERQEHNVGIIGAETLSEPQKQRGIFYLIFMCIVKGRKKCP